MKRGSLAPSGSLWRCWGGLCTPGEHRCDGRRNCGDGSDEDGCATTTTTTTSWVDKLPISTDAYKLAMYNERVAHTLELRVSIIDLRDLRSAEEDFDRLSLAFALRLYRLRSYMSAHLPPERHPLPKVLEVEALQLHLNVTNKTELNTSAEQLEADIVVTGRNVGNGTNVAELNRSADQRKTNLLATGGNAGISPRRIGILIGQAREALTSLGSLSKLVMQLQIRLARRMEKVKPAIKAADDAFSSFRGSLQPKPFKGWMPNFAAVDQAAEKASLLAKAVREIRTQDLYYAEMKLDAEAMTTGLRASRTVKSIAEQLLTPGQVILPLKQKVTDHLASALGSCGRKRTRWLPGGGRRFAATFALAKHNVQCGAGQVMTGWRLRRNRRNKIMLVYWCCNMGGNLLDTCETQETQPTKAERGKSVALAHHDVKCSGEKVMTQWRLKPGRKGNQQQISFKYQCCGLKKDLRKCTDRKTRFNLAGNGDIRLFQQHSLRCEFDEVMTEWRLQRGRSKRSKRLNQIAFSFKCCQAPIVKIADLADAPIVNAAPAAAPAAALVSEHQRPSRSSMPSMHISHLSTQ